MITFSIVNIAKTLNRELIIYTGEQKHRPENRNINPRIGAIYFGR